jgi:hypothetical protein
MMITLKVRQPLWRRFVVWFWQRAIILQEMTLPGSVDQDAEIDAMVRFLLVIEVDV